MSEATIRIVKGRGRGAILLAILLGAVAMAALSSALLGAAGASPLENDGSVPPAGYKVAFVGDTDNGPEFEAVLNLVLSEGADMVLHQGDFDYGPNPTAFFTLIDSVLGPNFPYLLSVGNHDDLAWNEDCTDLDGCYVTFLKARMAALGIVPDDPNLDDQKYAVEYQGLKMVFVGENGNNGEYGNFIADQLWEDNHVWKICSWHRNQTAMQAGGKSNDMSFNPYELCLHAGAIIATGHEHSYERTKTLVSTSSQLVDPTCSDPGSVCLGSGRSFVFVSGLGGRDIRNQDRCLPTTYPYGCNGEWAKIYTSNQNANYGALFITFNVDGDPNRAEGYFKTIDDSVIDAFELHADPSSASFATRALPVVEDAYVSSSSPDTNFGIATTLQVNGSNSLAYLKFDLSSLAGEEVEQARLRIKVTDGSIKEHSIKLVEDTSWSEAGITYGNRPASSMLLNSLKGINPGGWIDIDMSYAVRARSGQSLTISFEGGSEVLAFNSREAGADAPILFVKVAGGEPSVQFDRPSYTVSEADGAVPVSVTLSAPPTQTVSVHIASAEGTATAPDDFAPMSSTLVFAPGQTSMSFQLPIEDDDIEEPDETFVLILSNASGAILGLYDQAVVTIEDDDTPQYSLTLGTIGNGSVSLDPPGGRYDAGTVVTLTATADAGWDFHRWIGDLGISQSTTTLTMDGDKWVAATFSEIGDIAHEESVGGASSDSATVSTSGPLAAASGELYLAAVSTSDNISVSEISGLGLSWTSLGAQCAGRNQTGISVWWALGDPSGGTVTATLASTANNAVIAVSRYSGADTSDPIGAVASANTNGSSDTSCSGGTESINYAVDLTTTSEKAVAYGAVAIGAESHTPGSGFVERLEVSQGAGSMQAGLAVQDRSVATPAMVAVDGTLGKSVDWAVMAAEIRPDLFGPELYSLTTHIAGSGSVVLTPPGGLYGPGTVVTLTAEPDAGWLFVDWQGDLVADSNPRALTMDSNKAVTATFGVGVGILPPTQIVDEGEGQVTLTVTLGAALSQLATVDIATSDGSAIGGEDYAPFSGTLTFNPGEVNSVFAAPLIIDDDIDETVENFYVSLSNPQNVVLDPEAFQTEIWIVDDDAPSYSLEIGSVGQGAVDVAPPGESFSQGTVVTLTAVPEAHWEFAGWSGDLSGTANPVALTMDADKGVTATFRLKQYELVTATIGLGSVTLEPAGGVYTAGMTVTLTAVADEYWEFVGWSGDVSSAANPLTVTMDADKSVTATFAVRPDVLPHKLYLPAVLKVP